MRKPSASAAAAFVALLVVLVPGSPKAQRSPIRIGLLAPLTGPQAANGRDMVNGLEFFLEEHHGRLADRAVKLIVADDESKPAVGLTKVRGLVEGQSIHVLVGPLSSAVAYAIRDYLDAKKVPSIYAIAAGADITQRKRSPYIVRSAFTSGQNTQPFGRWVYDTLKYRRVAMLGFDFAFGWEEAAGFQRTFEEAGGQVVQKLWPPLGTSDYGPYLAQLRRDVDAVFVVFSGADALRFARQYAEAGLKDRIPLIGSGVFTDEHVLRSMGTEVLGVVTGFYYSSVLPNPVNQKFVRAYAEKYRQATSHYSEGTYTAGLLLKRALELTGGDAENPDRLMNALRRLEIQAPRGPLRFDDYGSPIMNIYVRRVERVNGGLQNTVIHTFPAVSQFWTYKPDEFLKNPVYSRDYPPCTHC